MYIQPCRFKSLYINDPWTSLLDNVLTTVKVLMNIFEIYADTVSHLYRRSGFSLVNELEKRGSNRDMDYDNIKPVLVASGLEVLCYTHMYIQPCRFKSLYRLNPWTSLLDNVLTTVKVLMNIFEIYADTVSHLYRRSGFSLVNELEKRGSNHDMISHFFKEYRVYIT